MVELIPIVDWVAKKIVPNIQNRVNIKDVLGWMNEQKNREEVDLCISDFDEVVGVFNGFMQGEPSPEYLSAIGELRGVLKNQALPTIFQLIEEKGPNGRKILFQFIKMMRETNERMQVGERIKKGEIKKEDEGGGYLAYHTTNTTPDVIFRAALMHAYVDFMCESDQLKPLISSKKLTADSLVDGLTECLGYIGIRDIEQGKPITNTLFDPIVNSVKMNWVKPYLPNLAGKLGELKLLS